MIYRRYQPCRTAMVLLVDAARLPRAAVGVRQSLAVLPSGRADAIGWQSGASGLSHKQEQSCSKIRMLATIDLQYRSRTNGTPSVASQNQMLAGIKAERSAENAKADCLSDRGKSPNG
jgi:hypothetical protein